MITLIFAVVATLGSAIEKFILSAPTAPAVYRNTSSHSVVSICIEVVLAPAASTNAPHVILAVRRRRFGVIRFPFASRSLSTQSDSEPVTITDDTGINSIRAIGPDLTASVDSQTRSAPSITTNR